MSKTTKFEFKGKEYTVKLPTYEATMNAQLTANMWFTHSIQCGVLLREEIDRLLVEKGMITEEDLQFCETYPTLLEQAIAEDKPQEEINLLRARRLMLWSTQAPYYEMSADTQADNAYYGYLAASCVYDGNNTDPKNLVWKEQDPGTKTFVPSYTALRNETNIDLVVFARAFVRQLMSAEDEDLIVEPAKEDLAKVADAIVDPIIIDNSSIR